MKTKLFLLLTSIIYFNINAQIGFETHVISTNAMGAFSVYASDIDGDGDMDVLSASWMDNSIFWYENTDGQGSFVSHLITSTAEGAFSVYATDLDGDGDIDVLSASVFDNKIAWYENTDGQGSFVSHLITSTAEGAFSVFAGDLDGDGDMDVLSASTSGNIIAWYENTDGQGTFGSQQIIAEFPEIENGVKVYASDIDGDGDLDVLSVSDADNKIAWYENIDGLGAFGSQQVITTNVVLPTSVHVGDLDGDGDMDVLSSSRGDNKIAWYENTDGQGSFGPQQLITDPANTLVARRVYASDLDGDGDLDVLSASWIDNKIAWYENIDGLGAFGPQQVITTAALSASSVYAVDINGDGDMDVLSSSRFDNKIAWYEQGILAVNENNLFSFSVYPSPTKGLLTIHSSTGIIQLEIYNLLGQLILSNTNHTPVGRAEITIDISGVNQGIYFIKVKDEYGSIGTQKIVKK